MSYSEQIQRYEGYLKADPTNPSIANQLAQFYLKAGQLDEADTLLKKNLALKPSLDGSVEFTLATVKIAMRHYDKALALLNGLTERNVRHAAVYYNRALCEMMLHQYETSAATLEQARKPDNPEFDYIEKLYLRALHHLGRMEEAYQVGINIVNRTENDAELYGAFALICLDLDKSDEAAFFAKRAIDLGENADARSVMGFVELENVNPDDAFENFSKATQTNPAHGRSWMGMGLCAMLAKNITVAHEYLKTASKLMPEHLGTLNVMTWTAIFSGNLKEAEQICERAMAQDRNFAETHGTLAVIQVLMQRHEEANVSIKVAQRLSPVCFSAAYAQLLLMEPGTSPDRMQRRIEQLLNTPFKVDSKTMGETIVSFLVRNSKKKILH